MLTQQSSLLLGLTAIVMLTCSCTSGERQTITESHLSVVWTQAPEIPDHEPWFGGSLSIDVHGEQIFVGDFIRKEILLLDENGNFIRLIGKQGNGPTEFTLPVFVSVASDEILYVDPARLRVLQRYSPDGDYLDQIAIEPRSVFSTSWLLAIADSVVAFKTSPGMNNPSSEVIAQVPLISVWDHGVWIHAGSHTAPLSEAFRRLASQYLELTQRTQEWMFRRGDIAKGISNNQLVFISVANPYEVHILYRTGNHTYWTYLEPTIPPGAVRHTDIPQDSYGEYRSKVPVDFYVDNSSSTSTQNYVTFSQAQRGFCIWNGNLYIYIEHLQADNSLYGEVLKVSLESKRLVNRFTIDQQTHKQFNGITASGLFIFSFNDPVPGIMAMKPE